MDTNNTGASDELILLDRDGVVPLYDLVGGTLKRVLLDIVTGVAMGSAGGPDSGHATDHHGLFVTADEFVTVPAGGIWDPNVPHGDFMTRWSSEYQAYFPVVGEAEFALIVSNGAGPNKTDGPRFLVDTSVQRRIRENDRLFISHWHFEDGTLFQESQYGWTGRVLIQLP